MKAIAIIGKLVAATVKAPEATMLHPIPVQAAPVVAPVAAAVPVAIPVAPRLWAPKEIILLGKVCSTIQARISRHFYQYLLSGYIK